MKWYAVWIFAALGILYVIGLSAPITTSSIVALSVWTIFVVAIGIIAWRHDDSDRQGD